MCVCVCEIAVVTVTVWSVNRSTSMLPTFSNQHNIGGEVYYTRTTRTFSWSVLLPMICILYPAASYVVSLCSLSLTPLSLNPTELWYKCDLHLSPTFSPHGPGADGRGCLQRTFLPEGAFKLLHRRAGHRTMSALH